MGFVMKSVIYTLILIEISISFSCKTIKYVPVPSTKDSIVTEKLMPVVTDPDSATIRALLQCDKNGKVLLSWYDQEVSKNTNLRFQIDSLGRLLANFVAKHDTIYMPQKTTIITKNDPYPVEVEKELSFWEKIKINIGGYAIMIITLLITYIIGKKIYKLKK